MKNNEHDRIVRIFLIRRTRQLIAVTAAILAAILLGAASRYPAVFGELSRRTISILLVAIILAFVNFSSFNWRCPSCSRYLGSDIAQIRCRKCGTSLR